MVNVQSKLNIATTAEILRSQQRDTDFVAQISANLTDILHRYGLYRTFSKLVKSEVPAKLFYFAATTGIGNQTIGEEFTGIVQANAKKRVVPSLLTRFLAAILECFGEQIVLRLLRKLQKNINTDGSQLTLEAKTFLNYFISKIETIVPIIILAHRGLFYIHGKYYSISRRLTGIDYVKVYGSRPHSNVNGALKMLGFATMVQCVLRLWQTKNIALETQNSIQDVESSSGGKCQLCLEKISDTTTPCGHLFCWNCLAEWLRARHRCPLCREIVAPSRIVPLMNL